jgi:hypothetical protein
MVYFLPKPHKLFGWRWPPVNGSGTNVGFQWPLQSAGGEVGGHLYQQKRTPKVMKTSSLNVNIAKKTRQVILLVLAIFIGMIFSVSTAEAKADDHRLGKKSRTELKRENKRYSNACKILASRKYKASKKDKKVKWR